MLDKLYRLIDLETTNQISTNQIMEFISNLTNARYEQVFQYWFGYSQKLSRTPGDMQMQVV